MDLVRHCPSVLGSDLGLAPSFGASWRGHLLSAPHCEGTFFRRLAASSTTWSGTFSRPGALVGSALSVAPSAASFLGALLLSLLSAGRYNLVWHLLLARRGEHFSFCGDRAGVAISACGGARGRRALWSKAPPDR